MGGRLGIDHVAPVVGMGDHPAKAVVGEHLAIGATVWREGHEAIGATVRWYDPDGRRIDLPMTCTDPGSDGPAVIELFGPLRNSCPIGWIGGRYTTSNPMAAIRGSSRAAVRSVPWTGRPSLSVPPVERGKNSYQLPNWAR